MRNINIPAEFQGKLLYSDSRMGTFENCEYGYYLNYIEKKKGKDNIYSLLGITVHDALEDLQQGKINNDEAIKRFKQGVIQAEILGMSFPSDKAKKNYIQCIEHYLTHYKPISGECIMEKEVYAKVGHFSFLGFVDLIIKNNDGTISIRDYKTSSKYSRKDLQRKGFQLILYGLALEREGYKVKDVGWEMLKYCEIIWEGATKMRSRVAERNVWVQSIINDISKDLNKLGYKGIEKELLMKVALENNNLNNMPDEVQNKYKVTKYVLLHPYTEENKEMFYFFINSILPKIESKTSNEEDWKPRNITDRDNFFCSVLCGHRDMCKHYKAYIKQKELNNGKKTFDFDIFS